jgi:hypothetical protein
LLLGIIFVFPIYIGIVKSIVNPEWYVMVPT